MEGGARTRDWPARGFPRPQPIVGEGCLVGVSLRPSRFAGQARALGPGAPSGRRREEAALPLLR